MDFNDIENRIARTYQSISKLVTANLINDVKVIKDGRWVELQIGTEPIEDTLNKIFIVLHNLANLKDPIKNLLVRKGLSGTLIETFINSLLHLQLLIDLVNQEKHGYPLTKSRRSDKDPMIIDVRHGISLGGGVVTSMSGNFPGTMFIVQHTEEMVKNPGLITNDATMIKMSSEGKFSTQGNPHLVIMATITDSKRNKLCSLDELVDISITKLETFINDHNLI